MTQQANGNNLTVLDFKAELIVSGLHKAHCPDALAHAVRKKPQLADTQNGEEEKNHLDIFSNIYQVYVQAYLPRLERDFPSPVINILPKVETLKTEVSEEEGKQARVIQIAYTSKLEHQPPFDLYSFFIEYGIKTEDSVPFIKIDLRNTDPETTRGTVTTVEDGDDDEP